MPFISNIKEKKRKRRGPNEIHKEERNRDEGELDPFEHQRIKSFTKYNFKQEHRNKKNKQINKKMNKI